MQPGAQRLLQAWVWVPQQQPQQHHTHKCATTGVPLTSLFAASSASMRSANSLSSRSLTARAASLTVSLPLAPSMLFLHTSHAALSTCRHTHTHGSARPQCATHFYSKSGRLRMSSRHGIHGHASTSRVPLPSQLHLEHVAINTLNQPH